LKIIFVSILTLILTSLAVAGETATTNGLMDVRENAFAFTHARIYRSSDRQIVTGMLLIKDEHIVGIEKENNVPEGYTEIDVAGRYIYPGLIDIYTEYGLPEVITPPFVQTRDSRKMESTKLSAFGVNEAIKAHYRSAQEWIPNAKSAKALRKLGFSTALSFRKDGVARGTSSLSTLGNELAGDAMLEADIAAHYSFEKGTSKQYFPTSRMGMVALLRQSYLDALWYDEQAIKPYEDQTLVAWTKSQGLVQIFETVNWNQALVADRLGDEFEVQYLIKGSGDEYQRLDLIKDTDATYIIPVNYPEAKDLSDPYLAQNATLAELKHWELAPYNLGMMSEKEIPFVITAYGNKGDFWRNLKLAVKNGLDSDLALSALTSIPAAILGQSQNVGALDKGLLANFIITSDTLFSEDAIIQENWIRGARYIVNKPIDDLRGHYQLNVGGQHYQIELLGEIKKPKAQFSNLNSNENDRVTVAFDEHHIAVNLTVKKNTYRLSGWRNQKGWKGQGKDPDGKWLAWSLAPVNSDKQAQINMDAKEAKAPNSSIGKVTYPFLAYGRENLPKATSLLFKNTTVWTNERDGILFNTDVLVQNGKIKKIGKSLTEKNLKVIDGSGFHLSSGIIDEHSHIALLGVNDRATNSAMVRMRDVVNSDDINIYRNLAGGVTAVQLLHGSANPIGGQSAIVKLRWGQSPEEMLIKDAAPFIKFALGENVKQTRHPASIRYPKSRMGVEQVFMDAFGQARQYEKGWQIYNELSRSAKKKKPAPRRDLVHETMLEVLNGERFVTSHSYVQSEINMLMKVAEFYDFRINTFTHILEGYKIADKMAAHGVGGSTFADRWGFKWEVRYAIPYNAALMVQAGVTTAINSDNAEMSRRLNQEAAKTIKYGGLSEEQAWKLVTLNPAKLLHLDERMGSIKVGKDADLVLWTENPLSVYAKVILTLVDGIPYFDAEEDALLQMQVSKERSRIIPKMTSAFLNKNPHRKSQKESGSESDKTPGLSIQGVSAP